METPNPAHNSLPSTCHKPHAVWSSVHAQKCDIACDSFIGVGTNFNVGMLWWSCCDHAPLRSAWSPLGGSHGMLPHKNFEIRCSEMHSGAIWACFSLTFNRYKIDYILPKYACLRSFYGVADHQTSLPVTFSLTVSSVLESSWLSPPVAPEVVQSEALVSLKKLIRDSCFPVVFSALSSWHTIIQGCG